MDNKLKISDIFNLDKKKIYKDKIDFEYLKMIKNTNDLKRAYENVKRHKNESSDEVLRPIGDDIVELCKDLIINSVTTKIANTYFDGNIKDNFNDIYKVIMTIKQTKNLDRKLQQHTEIKSLLHRHIEYNKKNDKNNKKKLGFSKTCQYYSKPLTTKELKTLCNEKIDVKKNKNDKYESNISESYKDEQQNIDLKNNLNLNSYVDNFTPNFVINNSAPNIIVNDIIDTTNDNPNKVGDNNGYKVENKNEKEDTFGLTELIEDYKIDTTNDDSNTVNDNNNYEVENKNEKKDVFGLTELMNMEYYKKGKNPDELHNEFKKFNKEKQQIDKKKYVSNNNSNIVAENCPTTLYQQWNANPHKLISQQKQKENKYQARLLYNKNKLVKYKLSKKLQDITDRLYRGGRKKISENKYPHKKQQENWSLLPRTEQEKIKHQARLAYSDNLRQKKVLLNKKPNKKPKKSKYYYIGRK